MYLCSVCATLTYVQHTHAISYSLILLLLSCTTQTFLQVRATKHLHVHHELIATIVNDEDTNRSTTLVESSVQLLEKAALVNNRQVLLNVATIGDGNNAALGDVQDAVLLENRAKHVLDVYVGAWVAQETCLFVELLAKEVDTEVAVLASLVGDADLDDLADAALKEEQIANADVVAGNGDCVWWR